MLKLCSKCLVSKNVTEFHKRGAKWQPMCKECKKNRSVSRYAEKGDYIREINKAWRVDNPEKMQQAREKWSAPRGYFAEARANSRAIAFGCAVIDRELTREFYNKCPKGMEVDHVKPLSRMGDHAVSNLQYISQHDNRVKANKWEGL